MDALSYILWEDNDRHIEADMVQALISNATQGTTLMGVYSCNKQVTETLDSWKDPKAMSLRDWIQESSTRLS